MRYMGSLFPPGQVLPSHAEARAAMAELPPVDPADVAVLKSYAGVIRDDYAAAAIDVLDATAQGRRVKVQRYALGAVAGVVVGAVAGYVLAGRR